VIIQLRCTDPAAVPVTYALDAGPAHGSLTRLDAATGRVTYTPAPGFAGADGFAYHAFDANGTSSRQSVTITVTKKLVSKAPVLAGLHIMPGAFHDRARRRPRGARRKTGATVSYTDSESATTTFTVLRVQPGVTVHGRCVERSGHRRRKASRCTRRHAVGSFRRSDRAGTNRFHFSAVLAGKPLSHGGYVLQAQAALGSLRSAAATVSFTVVP
jgi:hypothetical protein